MTNLLEKKAYREGMFTIEILRANGQRETFKSPNTIVSAGKAGLASRINGSGAAAAFEYLAVGTNATAVSAGDTTLGAETVGSGLSRVLGTLSRVTTSVTNDTARIATTFTVTGSVAITEIGIFNASSAGTMLCRTVFSALNVQNGDSLTVNYDIQAS
jgi:hypothetical protein